MKDTLIQWLRDAYAMERQALDTLEAHAGRLQHYPNMEQKIREHIGVTRRQAERLEGCLTQLGADTSTLKTGMARASSTMQAMLGTAAGDEVVKNAMADYTFEHYEISAYRCLIAAADAVGEPAIRQTCEEILREEEEMAAWIGQNLPVVTDQYLSRLQQGGTGEAKR